MYTLISLLAGNPFALLLVAIQLFLTTSFIPYQVARPHRKIPRFTYGLITLNTVIFLLTVLISNINLPLDKVAGQRAIQEYMATQAGQPAISYNPQTPPRLSVTAQSTGDSNTATEEAPAPPSEADLEKIRAATEYAKQRLEQQAALVASWKDAETAAGWQKTWQIQHAYSSYVLEPHYSTQQIFAYTAARPSIWGLLGSMFLHGSILHLLGNMLYLWVFGRALEETLGPLIYVGAYLICGVAATFLYHLITTMFTPQSAGIPLVGASGAIAGVLGLFALRFYRTPVRIFYVQPITLVVVLLGAGFTGLILAYLLSMLGAALALVGFFTGFIGVWAGFLIYMRKTAFGTFQLASAWSIGIWLAAFNLMPALMKLFSAQKEGGTAYWAHIGGFGFGMLYAALIGSQDEGKLEYALEDAQKEYEGGDMEKAIERAENVLIREPNNAGAYEVIAKAYDERGNETGALDTYEIAIQKYLGIGGRSPASALYLHALKKNPGFILPPPVQFNLANEMAKNADYKEAADNLAKIPFTFPDAPEGELALLRAAQIYVEQLNELDMATYLLNTLVERYPDTQWMVQVQRILKIADYKSRPEEGAPTA